MSICPFARQYLLGGRSAQTITPIRVTLHTAVSNARNLYAGGFGPGGTYSHFYINEIGEIWQYQDTGFKAYADLDGNNSTISVETWDGGKARALTDAQVAAFARLLAWARSVHATIPNWIATVADTRGLAWHRLGCAGNFGPYNANDRRTWSRSQTGLKWSNAQGKICPHDAKIIQIPEIFTASQPTSTKKEDPLMSLTDLEQKTLYEKTIKTNNAVGRLEKDLVPTLEKTIKQLITRIEKLETSNA